jgi:octaprenyl-diphosphate synthase
MQLPAHTDRPASVPQSRIPAFRLIDSQLSRVKALINEQMTSSAGAGDVNRLLKHVRGRSGKMIRPGLVLLAGGCCGKITDEHIRVAAIVEMIHCATLLHDDVIDEGQKRRGRPTINNLWGNESAVLLGDFLLGRVFEMCAVLGPPAAKVIAGVAVRVCEGELRQIIQRQNWQLSESEYIDVITEKSAVLFSSSCQLGALSAQATETQARSLAEFGMNAGIAFQITDDLLDIIGDENKTGKTLGRDADKHKLTLAVIHLLGAAGEREKGAIISSYLERKQYDKDALREMLGRYGSLEYTHSRAQEFVARAVGALGDLKESAAKDALIETSKFITGRVV